MVVSMRSRSGDYLTEVLGDESWRVTYWYSFSGCYEGNEQHVGRVGWRDFWNFLFSKTTATISCGLWV